MSACPPFQCLCTPHSGLQCRVYRVDCRLVICIQQEYWTSWILDLSVFTLQGFWSSPTFNRRCWRSGFAERVAATYRERERWVGDGCLLLGPLKAETVAYGFISDSWNCSDCEWSSLRFRFFFCHGKATESMADLSEKLFHVFSYMFSSAGCWVNCGLPEPVWLQGGDIPWESCFAGNVDAIKSFHYKSISSLWKKGV